MCEDQPSRRCPLQAILEACRTHQEAVAVAPLLASLHVRQLVGLVLGTIAKVRTEPSFSTQQPCGPIEIETQLEFKWIE